MAIRKPPCPPNCPNRKSACQGSCEAYKEYRAKLDEDKRIICEAKERERVWTKARMDGMRKSENFERKLSKGIVHIK